MNYHNITSEDMLNGSGLRVVLWVAGCSHHCENCQNKITWDPKGGIPFDKAAINEIMEKLGQDHINGITFSGGDPLYKDNAMEVLTLAEYIKKKMPEKTVWIYTGYLYESVKDLPGMEFVDVLVDGKFVEDLKNVAYPWAGSTNQRVIDVQRSRKEDRVVLWKGVRKA